MVWKKRPLYHGPSGRFRLQPDRGRAFSWSDGSSNWVELMRRLPVFGSSVCGDAGLSTQTAQVEDRACKQKQWLSHGTGCDGCGSGARFVRLRLLACPELILPLPLFVAKRRKRRGKNAGGKVRNVAKGWPNIRTINHHPTTEKRIVNEIREVEW